MKINLIDLANELRMDPGTDPHLQRDKDMKLITQPLRIPIRAHKYALLSPSVLKISRFNKCQMHFTLPSFSPSRGLEGC